MTLSTAPLGCLTDLAESSVSLACAVQIHKIFCHITRWVRAASRPYKRYKPANPLTGLAPLGPLKSIQNTPPPKKSNICAKGATKGSLPPSWAIWGKFGFFDFFQNYSPLGGQPKKSISRLPTGPIGWPMPNLVEIHLVLWAPNPNKQTERQTDRQTDRQTKRPLLYIWTLKNILR